MPSDKPALSISHLTVRYQTEPVLWNITTSIPQGTLVAVVGPNGAGKTTFIKSLINIIKPDAGAVSFFGGTYQEHIKRIAYVPQRLSVDWDFPANVLDVVLMGRYAHMGWFKRPSEADYDAAWLALEQVHMTNYAYRHISQLSGGQQQRVFLARALVQNADLYVMDEPFMGIDMSTEHTIVEILKTLRNQGKTIIVVHHDLQTLQDYFDWLLLLNVKLIACGPIQEVLHAENLHATYGKHTLFTTCFNKSRELR